MIIHFKFYTKLRDIIGRETVKLNLKKGSTIQAGFNRLIAKFGKEVEKELSDRRHWVIMLNDKNINFLNDLNTSLKHGDRIAILSPLAGG